MPTRRRRHQVDQRPVRYVLAFDHDDWLAWVDANGYEIVASQGFTLRPDSSAWRDDSRAHRVVDHTDAITGIGHELVETEWFANRDDADELRLLASRQLRPRLVK